MHSLPSQLHFVLTGPNYGAVCARCSCAVPKKSSMQLRERLRQARCRLAVCLMAEDLSLCAGEKWWAQALALVCLVCAITLAAPPAGAGYIFFQATGSATPSLSRRSTHVRWRTYGSASSCLRYRSPPGGISCISTPHRRRHGRRMQSARWSDLRRYRCLRATSASMGLRIARAS